MNSKMYNKATLRNCYPFCYPPLQGTINHDKRKRGGEGLKVEYGKKHFAALKDVEFEMV